MERMSGAQLKSEGMRIGIGVDYHRFASQRKLILGGVEIDYKLGLAGHSDADVLTHAICDALLGAAGLGDIGRHFPPDDPRYKDISSLVLLKEVRELLQERGYRIENIDATVIAQEPQLAGAIPEMISRLARTLQVEESQINIKATTPEGMGALGKKEGIAAWAVALISGG